MTRTIPMTELNYQLSGKDGLAHLQRINALLEAEITTVRAKMKRGLNREEYNCATRQVVALVNANQIVNSLYVYHNRQK